MKRILSLLLLLGCLTLSAQESSTVGHWRYDIGLGICPIYHPGALEVGEYFYTPINSIETIETNNYSFSVSPTYSMRAAYQIKERWFLVTSLGFCNMKIDYYNPYSGEKTYGEKTYGFDVLVGGRWVYATKAGFYAQVLVGYAHQGEAEYWNRLKKYKGYYKNIPLQLGYQIGVGLTVNLGSMFYLNFDWGVGTEHANPVIGGRAAFGVKL